jgi:hypothetical protein
VHKTFMDKVIDDTNQGTHSQGDPCAFPFFRNVGVPLMATLYIPGLNVGLLVWLGTIPNVPNDIDASHLSTLCHGNNVDVPLLENYSPHPSPTSRECIITSNWKSKRSRKRNNRKNKSPISASHVGDVKPTTASHAGGIDSVENPRWIGHKPKFSCNLFKGDTLTHLCPSLPKVRTLWPLSAISSDSESFEVSS